MRGRGSFVFLGISMPVDYLVGASILLTAQRSAQSLALSA